MEADEYLPAARTSGECGKQRQTIGEQAGAREERASGRANGRRVVLVIPLFHLHHRLNKRVLRERKGLS